MIRTYKESDFDMILALLNRNKRFDSFTDQLLREKLYRDPDWNEESTLIAEKSGVIVGFMQGVTREIRGTAYGYIKLMAVEKQFRREGIGTKLYNELENLFVNKKIAYARIYDSPLNYFMPGIDPRYTSAVCFAQSLGFEKIGEACNMIVDLYDSDWETGSRIEELKRDHVEITRASREDRSELLDFISVEWILWKFEIEMTFKLNPPSLFIARKGGAIKAFAAYDANNVGTGWFGPMGTDPVLRGKGIGTVLLYLCLEEMKKKGLRKSIIPWVAPIRFYSHYANATVDRVFWRYEKKLKSN